MQLFSPFLRTDSCHALEKKRSSTLFQRLGSGGEGGGIRSEDTKRGRNVNLPAGRPIFLGEKNPSHSLGRRTAHFVSAPRLFTSIAFSRRSGSTTGLFLLVPRTGVGLPRYNWGRAVRSILRRFSISTQHRFVTILASVLPFDHARLDCFALSEGEEALQH